MSMETMRDSDARLGAAMKNLDPIIESALGCRSRLGRAIVFLDRAAWMLEEAQKTIALAPDLEALHTTIDILRGGTARAAHDLAAIVCSSDPYPGQAAALPAEPEILECPNAMVPCPAAGAEWPGACGNCEYQNGRIAK